MKMINMRELRAAVPRLQEALALKRELVPLKNGEPIARIALILPSADAGPRLPSLKAFRDSLPQSETPVEVLIREERDRR